MGLSQNDVPVRHGCEAAPCGQLSHWQETQKRTHGPQRGYQDTGGIPQPVAVTSVLHWQVGAELNRDHSRLELREA